MLKNEQSHMAPMATNIAGGKQSHITRAYTLVPPNALAEVASVLHSGASKYGVDNWKLIPVDDHLNHVLNHIFLYLAGNEQEHHLSHAATRMMMALELHTELEEHYDDN
jgi:hypothetical protein